MVIGGMEVEYVLKKCGNGTAIDQDWLPLDRNVVTISRHPKATYTIKSIYLSRQHAILLQINGSHWTIEDKSSFNGIYLNDTKIEPNRPFYLVEGDLIGLGMEVGMQHRDDSVVFRFCRKATLHIGEKPEPEDIPVQPVEGFCGAKVMGEVVETSSKIGSSDALPTPGMPAAKESNCSPSETSGSNSLLKKVTIPLLRCNSDLLANNTAVKSETLAMKSETVAVKSEDMSGATVKTSVPASDSDDSDVPPEAMKRRAKVTSGRPKSSNDIKVIEVIDLCSDYDNSDDDGDLDAEIVLAKSDPVSEIKNGEIAQECRDFRSEAQVPDHSTGDGNGAKTEEEEPHAKSPPPVPADAARSHAELLNEELLQDVTDLESDDNIAEELLDEVANLDLQEVDCFVYSQDDEVIIISDDDYDDAVSAKSANVCIKEEMVVKTELPDIKSEVTELTDDDDDDDWSVLFQQEMKRETSNLQLDQSLSCFSTYLDALDKDDVENAVGMLHGEESPDAGPSFLKALPGSSPTTHVADLPGRSTSTADIAGKATACVLDTADYWPVLSQSFDDDLADGAEERDDDDNDSRATVPLQDVADTRDFFPVLSQSFDDDLANGAEESDDDDGDTTISFQEVQDTRDFFPVLSQGFDDDLADNAGENEAAAPQDGPEVHMEKKTDFFPGLSQGFDVDDAQDVGLNDKEPATGKEDLQCGSVEGIWWTRRDQLTRKMPAVQQQKPKPTNRSWDRLKKSSKGAVATYGPQLTSAQPMRTGRRSRETQLQPVVPLPEHTRSPVKAAAAAASPVKYVARPTSKPRVRKNSLKGKVLHNSGYRIRAPGGGSAIPTSSSKPPGHPSAGGQNSAPVGSLRATGQAAAAAAAAAGRQGPKRWTSYDSSDKEQRSPIDGAGEKMAKRTVPHRDSTSRGDRLAQEMLQSGTVARPQPSKRKSQLVKPLSMPEKKARTWLDGDRNSTPSRGSSPTPLSSSSSFPPPKIDFGRGAAPKTILGKANREQNVPAKRVKFSDDIQTSFIEPREKPERPAPQVVYPRPAPPKQNIVGRTYETLLEVLNWMVKWLEEQERCRFPPPGVVGNMRVVSTRRAYNCHADYVMTYRPLMLLETWEDVSQKWRQVHGKGPEFQMVLSSADPYIENGKQALMLNFYAVVPSEKLQTEDYPNEGWLTVLSIPVHANNSPGKDKTFIQLFAYVMDCRKSSYATFQKSGCSPPILDQLAANCRGEKTLLTINMMTKMKVMNMRKNSVFKVLMISKFRKHLQLFEVMNNMMDMPLGQFILAPAKDLCTLPAVPPQQSIATVGKILYNTIQRQAIVRVTKACIAEPTIPKILLIHGPPGTGKTAVIAALVVQLLFGDHVQNPSKKPQILLCAPSNNAVDEDVSRLQEYHPLIKDKGRLRIVRLGQIEHVHPDVSGIHIDALVRKNMFYKGEAQIKSDIKKIVADITQLQRRLEDMKQRGKMGEVGKLRKVIANHEEKQGNLEMQLHRVRKRNASAEDKTVIYEKQREEILLKADVIATTLGSCCQGGMEMFLGGSQPLICIVDEATQCTEPEILLPLQFGILKLVLVGDPYQLPSTVLSQKAKERGYEKSLFERMYLTFKSNPPSPALMLDVQYRMHPEICIFPSEAFYRGKLRTDSEVRKRTSDVPFVPYMFFDIVDSQEQLNGDHKICNMKEAQYVTQLAEVLMMKDPTLHIGIITFYNHQKHTITDMVKKSEFLARRGVAGMIEINTVDAFQGREKDIIIISAVRANSRDGSIGFLRFPQRLNVAITRGRSAVYICGHSKSLEVADNWKNLIGDAERRKKLVRVSSAISIIDLKQLVIKSP